RVIELTFADEDIKVVAVSDGDQAIERLEATTPDIVLADIGMPGRNGYEVAQFMRRTPRLAHIPVVLLTGAFEPVDQERAAQAGCDGVLAKPFEPQMVIGRVRELLSRPRTAGEHPSAAAVAPEAVAPAESRPQPFDAAGGEGGELNAYFDRLDAAFANLESGQPSAVPAQVETAAEKWDLDALESLPPVRETSRGSQPPAPVAPDMGGSHAPEPLTPVSHYEAPPPVASFAAPVPIAVTEPLAPLSVVSTGGEHTGRAPGAEPPAAMPASSDTMARSLPPKPPALPSLADAFAALLAAEQGPLSDIAVTWPATLAPPAPPAPAAPAPVEVTEELIEAVTRRVLDRLSDRVVRETVSDIVSKVAERLISEEIARIKSAIE
ncbi:MAG TPA: response regulator, partial [Vicinamibacterales bacterium]